MSDYEMCLQALHALLVRTNAEYWARYIGQDIQEWEYSKSVEHHLWAYGGMGSLNDVYLCVQNGNSVTAQQEPFANELLRQLLVLCFRLGSDIRDKHKTSVEELVHRARPLKPVLRGSVCNNCGYTAIGVQGVDAYIAPDLVNKVVAEGLENKNLIGTALNCLDLERCAGVTAGRKLVDVALERSNIALIDEPFMRPCVRCASDDTSVAYWEGRDTVKTMDKGSIIFIRTDMI